MPQRLYRNWQITNLSRTPGLTFWGWPRADGRDTHARPCPQVRMCSQERELFGRCRVLNLYDHDPMQLVYS